MVVSVWDEDGLLQPFAHLFVACVCPYQMCTHPQTIHTLHMWWSGANTTHSLTPHTYLAPVAPHNTHTHTLTNHTYLAPVAPIPCSSATHVCLSTISGTASHTWASLLVRLRDTGAPAARQGALPLTCVWGGRMCVWMHRRGSVGGPKIHTTL